MGLQHSRLIQMHQGLVEQTQKIVRLHGRYQYTIEVLAGRCAVHGRGRPGETVRRAPLGWYIMAVPVPR
jgi:hypothetical protein